MKSLVISASAAILLAGVSFPAQAQSVLGVVGPKGSDAAATLGSGDAGNSGLANVGVGGDNQVLDPNIGGTDSSIANATVGSGGGSAADADIDLLGGGANADVTVGGGGLAGVTVGVGSGGSGGSGASPAGNGSGAGGGVAAVTNARSATGALPDCDGVSGQQVQALLSSTQIDGSWQRASNVSIERVDVCPALRIQLSATLSSSGLGDQLQSAILSDPLLSASLARSSYSASRVFAVEQDGNTLTVYVY